MGEWFMENNMDALIVYDDLYKQWCTAKFLLF